MIRALVRDRAEIDREHAEPEQQAVDDLAPVLSKTARTIRGRRFGAAAEHENRPDRHSERGG